MKAIEILDESELRPSGKVYTETMVVMAAFFGSPLAAGYLFAENYKALQQPHKVQGTWAVAIGGTIALFVLTYAIEYFIELPTVGLGIGIAFATRGIFRSEQAAAVTEHIAKGGELHSAWRAFGVTLAVFGVIAAIVLAITLFSVYPSEPEQALVVEAPEISTTIEADFQTQSYGDAGHVIVYNRADISDEEIDAIAAELTTVGFFDKVNSKTVYLEINGGQYTFTVTQADVDPSDSATQALYNNAKAQLEAFVEGTTVELILMDEDLEYTLSTF
jgi:hypothetical protein